MRQLLRCAYGLNIVELQKSSVGAGSDTYFATCADGKYVVKYPASSEINHPEPEPELCEFLLQKGIPVCQFLRNKAGGYLSADEKGRKFHVEAPFSR